MTDVTLQWLSVLAKWISPLLALLGLAKLWGKHTESVRNQKQQFEEFKETTCKDQAAMIARLEKQDSKTSEAVKAIYERIHKDDRRRDDREDQIRRDMNQGLEKLVNKFDEKLDKLTDIIRDK